MALLCAGYLPYASQAVGGMSIGVSAKGSGNLTAISNGVTTTSGSTLVVFTYYQTGFTSIVDSNTNTWNQVDVERSIYGGGQLGRMYWAENITGGASHTVTIVSTGFVSFGVVEILVASANSDDAGSFASLADDAGSEPYDSLTSGTLSQAVEMVIYGIGPGDGAGSTVTLTESTGFTKAIEDTDGAGSWPWAIFYKLTDATTALTPSASTGDPDCTEAVCFIAGFK